MTNSGAAILQPTFTGHVASTHDALILFEACLTGQLSHVPRRPHDRERNSLIRSGSIFIYEENASGIKRWTDGVTWSPSRILGNFLVYRELDKPFPPGEKKKAHKVKNRRPTRPGEPYPRPESTGDSYSPTATHATTFGNDRAPTEIERQLIGSLIDSYGFKADGLVKKTMSVTVQGVTHHLVSYYNIHDVIANQLRTPSQLPELQYLRPRPELTSKQSFRAPLEEVDEAIEAARDGHQGPYGYRPLGPQSPFPGGTPYYLSGNYPHPPPHHQVTSAGYAVGGPAIAGSYIPPHLAPPQMPPRDGEYSSFGQAPYNRSYDSLNSNMSATSHRKSFNQSGLPSNLPDRSQSHQPVMYPPSNMQPRMTASSPVPIEARTAGPYERGSFGSNQPTVDQGRPMQPSLKYEDRRDSQHHNPAPPYPNERPPYYMNGPSGQYQPGPPMTSWTSSAPAHPSI